MDLGIRGRTAIVCAASKGLGRGSAEALAAMKPLVTYKKAVDDTLGRARGKPDRDRQGRGGRHERD